LNFRFVVLPLVVAVMVVFVMVVVMVVVAAGWCFYHFPPLNVVLYFSP
jgi:hypothetical protein